MEIRTLNGMLNVRSGEEQQNAYGGTPSNDRLYIEWRPADPESKVAALTLPQMLALADAILQRAREVAK